MNHRNLLPPARRAAKARRRATRRWVMINSAYAVLLALAGGAYAYSASTAPTPAAANVAKLNSTLVSLRQQTAASNTNLRALLEVTDQADWSILLSVLANLLGDDVVLSSVDTTPTGNAPAGNAAAAGPNRFVISGIGRSQLAVTQYVLRVEALGFFKQVRLTQTMARPLHGTEGVGFQLVCTLPAEGTK